MARNNVYCVEYNNWFEYGKKVYVLASNKYDAYDKAVYEEIPKIEGGLPYSAWVASVTYQNGNYHRFNTFEGNPY